MGVGKQKGALVKQVSNNVYCGVRLGGMGVAIGRSVASLTTYHLRLKRND